MKDPFNHTLTLPELTVRGCILATLITIVFTAANVYLGLKVGLTLSSAIPAAVISMAVLKAVKDANILENTTVQTFASSAGTLTALIFTLPGLLMVGFWNHFPIWQTLLIAIVGGILGVMYSIPLRRALVVQSDLPYPEGTAAAEILKIGNQATTTDKNEPGIREIILGTAISGLVALCSRGFKFLSESIAYYGSVGGTIFGFSNDYSFALVGAGYLMGTRVGIAMIVGTLISWGIIVPYFSVITPHTGAIADVANQIWAEKARFIGVGVMAVASLWTMVLLLKPIWVGIKASWQAVTHLKLKGKNSFPRTEQDIPITTVITSTLLLTLPLAAIFGYFIYNEHLPLSLVQILFLTLFCVIFIMIFGFITAAVSGYMAGLIGSSNSPLSGVSILSLIGSAVLLSILLSTISQHYSNLIIALSIYITSATIAVGAISNDNLQDLKTGQLVGATPWRQQLALIYGVIVGAIVIPFILEVLYRAYGFVGAMPHPGMDPSQALAAPQAMLMASLAKGIITHNLDWSMIIIGGVFAVVFIIFDATILKRYNARLSLLAISFGIYLPMEVNIPVIIGSAIYYFVERHCHKQTQQTQQDFRELRSKPHRRGVLIASGLIVGESVIGVIIAGLIVATGKEYPLALVSSQFAPIAAVLGLVVFILLCVGYYRYIVKRNK